MKEQLGANSDNMQNQQEQGTFDWDSFKPIDWEQFQKEEEERKRQTQYREDGIELLRAATVLSANREDRIRAQRMFENNERALNQKLTRVEELRLLALDSEQSGIDRSEMEYEGKKVVLYDMHNEPFAGLVTAVDYRSDWGLSEARQGKMMQDELRKDPSLWTKGAEDVRSILNERGVDEARVSNMISTSYINTEYPSTLEQHKYKELLYGFDNVSAGTILRTRAGDAATPQWQEEASLNHAAVQPISDLEKTNYAELSGHYNEVAIKRYDEKGQPKNPDYILARNGQISDEMLKHAAFFGIPIINIDYDSNKREQLSD